MKQLRIRKLKLEIRKKLNELKDYLKIIEKLGPI